MSVEEVTWTGQKVSRSPRAVMAVLAVLSVCQLSQYPAAVDELIYKPVWPVC